MKRILSPSILAADFANLGQQICTAAQAGAEYVHIDIMDGLFVPSISIGIPVVSSIRGCTKSLFDIHLMIVEPIRYVQQFADAGADIITFHLEACKEPQEIYRTIEAIRNAGCRVGISIKPKTPVAAVLPYLELVDMVLLMTVEPGFGGQAYIPESTERIRTLRSMIDERNLPTDLEVDGGIKAENVSIVLEAGANVIVAGTAVYRGNISENVALFLKLFESKSLL